MLKIEKITGTIRQANQDDMGQVFKLIKEFADFAKLGHKIKINAETLKLDGFSENPSFTCLVAEVSDGYIIGYAIYYKCYTTWLGKSIFLEELYVQPAYRGYGIGKRMLIEIARVAHDMSGRLDFRVLSWNPIADFYKSLGAVNLTEHESWQLYRLDKDSLEKLFG